MRKQYSKPQRLAHDYVLLITFLIVGLFTLIITRHQISLQLLSAGATAIGYISWGIWHHKRLGNLNSRIVLEYSLIGLCAFSLFGSNFIALF